WPRSSLPELRKRPRFNSPPAGTATRSARKADGVSPRSVVRLGGGRHGLPAVPEERRATQREATPTATGMDHGQDCPPLSTYRYGRSSLRSASVFATDETTAACSAA